MRSRGRYIVPVLTKDKSQFDGDDSVVLGGDTTQLQDGRPVKVQAWSESGYTFVTYFLSIVNLENHSEDELINYLNFQGIKMGSCANRNTSILRYKDINRQECWSVTLAVGESDD